MSDTIARSLIGLSGIDHCMKRASVFAILAGFVALSANAQSPKTVDSLLYEVSGLNQRSWQLQVNGNYDSSIFYAKHAAHMANGSDLFNELATANQYIGEGYMRLHNRDSSLKYLNNALRISVTNGLREFEAGVYNSLANVDLNESRYESAFNNFIRSANIYDSVGNKVGLSKALSNIGNIEYRLGHLEKAIAYALQSKAMAGEGGHVSGVAYAHKLLGWIYRKKGMLNEALSQYDSALQIYHQLGSNRDIAEVALSTGNAFFDKSDYSRAIRYYLQSMNASRSLEYEPFLPYAYSGLAYSYHSMNDNSKALIYTDSLEAASGNLNPNLLLDAYDLKSTIWESERDYKQALLYRKKYQSLRDSLTISENRLAIEEAEAKYQNDIKQREIDQLKQKNVLRESRSRIIWVAAAVALMLVIVITVLIVNRFIIINRSNRLLEIERMRNAIARDLHDDIGSALSSINIMSKVALQKMLPETLHQHFKSIEDQSSKVMESMSDIVWSINPDNDTIQNVLVKMREFAAEILEPKNIQVQFEKSDRSELIFNSEQRKNIFLVFKEGINNAAKYSGCSLVLTSLIVANKELTLRIQDNGKGFDLNTIKTGNGIRNMRARAEALNGKLDVMSSKESGTTILLKINLT